MKEQTILSQGQQMVQRLAPRQVQFVRLLEMTAPEIEEEVRRQLDDNPALEKTEEADVDTPAPAEAETFDTDTYDPDDDPADKTYAQRPSGGTDPSSWQIAADGADLGTWLESQLGQADLPERTRAIAAYIVGNLDANGYLTRSLTAMADDLAVNVGIDVTPQEMKQAFDAVRELEPAGVGAVDLRDCLLLQLQRKQPLTLPLKIAREVVADYFDLLSKKHYDRLQAQLGLHDDTELRKALSIIRSLNPKPGSAIANSTAMMRIAQITPDVTVEVTDDGRYTVSLPGSIPALQVERTFRPEAEPPARNKAEREAQAFVRLKRDDAEAFIGALRQRGTMLIDVTQAIVRRQPEFFATSDPSTLRPLILKDIAADTGYDVSMVSRATSGKYVATPMGVYPLKMFFNEAPTDDAATSSHQLMQALREIVDAEDKRHPLSDEAILKEMEKRGHKLARRTVTKYREKLNIPVGRLRKHM